MFAKDGADAGTEWGIGDAGRVGEGESAANADGSFPVSALAEGAEPAPGGDLVVVEAGDPLATGPREAEIAGGGDPGLGTGQYA